MEPWDDKLLKSYKCWDLAGNGATEAEASMGSVDAMRTLQGPSDLEKTRNVWISRERGTKKRVSLGMGNFMQGHCGKDLGGK